MIRDPASGLRRIVWCPFAGSRSRSKPHPGPCLTTPGTGTVNGSIPGLPTRRLLPGSTILPGSPDSRFRVPSSLQGSWRPIGIAGMSSLDFTVGLILVMSGAPGLRWVSWTLRMGASRGEDCRIPRHALTAISGESPQGGFRHLPPHFQSEVQHRPASGARAWPERRRRAGVEGFSGQGPGFHAEYGGCPFGSERNRASRRRQGPAAGGGAPVRAREGVARPKPGGRACGIPSPPSADGAKRLREAAPARKPPPASGSRAPCGGARSGCPGPASRGRP